MAEAASSSTAETAARAARTGGIVAAVAAALLYFVVVPVLLGGNGYVLNVITTASMLSFISLGVWLTFAIGRINIGQAGFAMIGGYTTAILMRDLQISYWLCLPLSGLVAAAVGAAIGWPVLRLKGVYFAMITLCLTEACRLAALTFASVTRGAQGIVDLPLPGELAVFGVALIPAFEKGERLPFYFLAGVLLFLGLLLQWLVDTSRVGNVFRALRQNEDLAESLGINVARYRVLAYAICCFYGGIGGAFFTAFQQNIYPASYQVIDSVYFMVYCFVGGLEFVIGPVVGTFLLAGSFELLHGLQRYQTVLYAALMILCILFLPNGVLSLRLGRART